MPRSRLGSKTEERNGGEFNDAAAMQSDLGGINKHWHKSPKKIQMLHFGILDFVFDIFLLYIW